MCVLISPTSHFQDALGSFMKLEVHDKWIPGKESPQYDFNVPKIEGTNSVTVSLIQKNRRQLKDEGFDNILIGFDLLLVNEYEKNNAHKRVYCQFKTILERKHISINSCSIPNIKHFVFLQKRSG